jgi:hypothetical protein
MKDSLAMAQKLSASPSTRSGLTNVVAYVHRDRLAAAPASTVAE